MNRFFKKRTHKSIEVSPRPSWNQIVAMMYDKTLNVFNDEVVRVIYSNDKTMRYIILKSENGFFTYILEQIYQYSDDEWEYKSDDELCPAFWGAFNNDCKSIYSTLEDALKELENEIQYKLFFNH